MKADKKMVELLASPSVAVMWSSRGRSSARFPVKSVTSAGWLAGLRAWCVM